MIEFDNVSLSYGDRVVLDHINLAIGFYERTAVLGGSGEGKTTILKLMLGLTRPDSGRIIIDGEEIHNMSEARLRHVRMKFSIVFQEGALFDSVNVHENVAFCLREYSHMSENEIETRVRSILRRVNMEEAIHLMPEELSGGMARRVAIARSLAGCTPRIMLYDEPTTGLDPLSANNICSLIRELSAGESQNRIGFIVVTHKVMDAVKVAERFMFIRNGKIAFDGDLASLRNVEDSTVREFVNELFLSEECRS